MRQQGTVVRWEAARGFGFIRGTAAQDIFFHVQDFRMAWSGQPSIGMQVDFETIHVGGKGPRAMAVRPAGTRDSGVRGARRSAPTNRRRESRTARAGGSGGWVALPLMLAYGGLLLFIVWTKQAPWWLLPASFGLNLATFFAYWQDKYAAEQGKWRISEDTLHLWSLAGGWGGAWFAQQVLRHKSRKTSFRATYWLTVVAHCAGLGYWAYPQVIGAAGL